jgi:long-chain fatty acid transport protein
MLTLSTFRARSRKPLLFAALTLSLCAGRARAAGFYYADLGARELGRGATGAAGAGDLSAIIYNPAGLAELSGLTVQLDLQLAQQHTTFTRGAPYCGETMAACAPVSDTAGLFANTVSGVALNLGVLSPELSSLVVAAGVHGPPAIGDHSFPDPRNFGTAAEVAAGAPQRYTLISASNIILYPGLAAGWRVNDWFSLGAGAELRYFHITQSQSLFAIGGISGDFPEFDAIATIDAKQVAYPVFDGGVIVRPIPALRNLSLGLSGRLGAPVSADGTISIVTPPAAQALDIAVEGNRAHVALRLPSEARLGLQWKNDRALVEFDGTWEGWGALRNITVTPENVSIVSGSGASQTTTPVAPIVLEKDFHGAFTARLGGEWTFADLLPARTALTLRAGGIYESSAIPDQTLQVDFVDGPRFAGTLGLSVASHGFSLTLAYAHYFQSTRDITDSTATRVNAVSAPPFIIGNGVYQTSLDAVAIDLGWHGL